MKKIDYMLFLRIGFGIFFLFWGLDRLLRVDTWANDAMLGSFYGSLGAMSVLVMIVGIIQVLIAMSLLVNYKTKITSGIALVMIGASLVVTIVPLVTYLINGVTPIPNILFLDHFPLLAGMLAIYIHAK